MIQIATNPDQSARLIAYGVETKTADMVNVDVDEPNVRHNYTDMTAPYNEPAWSLSALLALLPTEIKEDNGYFDEISTYGLHIYPYMQGWQIDYQYCEDDECHCLKCIHDSKLIEVCVKAIEWLTQNNYKLNNNG